MSLQQLEEALPCSGPGGQGARRRRARKGQPGKYSQLVVETIRRLAERGGSSLARVHAEARKVAWFDQRHGRTYLKYAVRALVQNGTLLQVRGTGANGSFKLNRPPKPQPQASKPAPRPRQTTKAAAAPKAKKAAKPSVPKVPKGRK